MNKLTITPERFLDWYYDYGQDSENNELREDLAKCIISQMRTTGFGSMSVNELFDNCNHDSIRYCFTRECQDENDDRELSELENYSIDLVCTNQQ